MVYYSTGRAESKYAMKECPKCNSPHEKAGKFCSQSCANARQHSPEIYKKIGKAISVANTGRPRSEAEKRSILKAGAVSRARVQERNANTSFEDLAPCAQRPLVLASQNYACLHCQNTTWLGKPIALELDHIDGGTSNNVRENLRALCPNCHAQTPTWRRGWKKKKLVPPTGIEPVSTL